jgi:hypothetical protein
VISGLANGLAMYDLAKYHAYFNRDAQFYMDKAGGLLTC